MDEPSPKQIKKTNYKKVNNEKACKCDGLKAFFEELMEKQMTKISAQYQVLLEEVAQQKVLVQQLLRERTNDFSNLTIINKFPIKNKEDLTRINKEIEVVGKLNYVKCMTQLLEGAGVVKNLKNIITDELAMHYNIDGVLGKDSLKSLTHFFDALIESIPIGKGAGSPEDQLRQALQRQKKRVIKKNHLLNKNKRV